MKSYIVKLINTHGASLLCIMVILIQFLQILYFKRATFFTPYDSAYWKDRYEHSQYQLPLSQRIIGDDGLYAYAGYRLALGDDPFSINVDKPPAGKYLIGFSTIFFGNPIIISLFLGIMSLALCYLVSGFFFKNKYLSLLFVSILALDPLFFSQLSGSWLDLPQLFFLLLNIVFLLYSSRIPQRSLLLLLSGLSLGLFAETKPPILLPIILLLECIFLVREGLKKSTLFYVFGLVVGIILPYARYMNLNHSLLDVARVHKFMVVFYQQTRLPSHPEALLQTLLTGYFPDILTRIPIRVSEWWIIWPFMTVIGLSMAIYILRKRSSILWKGLALFLLSGLIINTFLPSYPRYLLLLLPFFYLFFIQGISYLPSSFIRQALYAILLVTGLFHSYTYLQPDPRPVLDNFYYNLTHQYFHDIYEERVDGTTKSRYDRNEFRLFSQLPMKQAQIQAINVKENRIDIPKFGRQGSTEILITYATQHLGSFTEVKNIQLTKEKDQWKIQWDWNMIFNKYYPGAWVDTQVVYGNRGSIIGPKRKVLVSDGDGYRILVKPEELDTRREDELLMILKDLSYQSPVSMHNAYTENILPQETIPLITTFISLDKQTKEKLLTYPGVVIEPYRSRLYQGVNILEIANTQYEECCTRLYTSSNYHGIKGYEKQFDSILSGNDGGRSVLKDSTGKTIRVLVEQEPKSGDDIVLESQ